MTRCHNCATNNCSEEEYLARPLPIPPDYIDNLQSRLVKVEKRSLPPTLKMILKAYYLPARQALVTSPAVQPDDMMGRHRDGEHNRLEQPQVSGEGEKVVADGTSSTDKGGFCFSDRGRDGPRGITSRRSPFRIGDVSATSRDNSEEHRLGGRLPYSSRLRGEPGNSDNSTSRRPRGGCDRPASARDDID